MLPAQEEFEQPFKVTLTKKSKKDGGYHIENVTHNLWLSVKSSCETMPRTYFCSFMMYGNKSDDRSQQRFV